MKDTNFLRREVISEKPFWSYFNSPLSPTCGIELINSTSFISTNNIKIIPSNYDILLISYLQLYPDCITNLFPCKKNKKKLLQIYCHAKQNKDIINIEAYSWISSIHISHSIFHSYFFIFVPGGALIRKGWKNY